jgi:hypothetical protein
MIAENKGRVRRMRRRTDRRGIINRKGRASEKKRQVRLRRRKRRNNCE